MTDVQIKQVDRDIWFQTIAVGKTYADADMLEAARRNIDSGMYDDLPAMRAIAFSRQAAEKAQQERDAGIADAHMQARLEAAKKALARKAKSEARDHESMAIEALHIATAIRSQGHE